MRFRKESECGFILVIAGAVGLRSALAGSLVVGGEDSFLFLLVVTSSYFGLGTHSFSIVACMFALPVEI